jgi:hypothetical protein
MAKERELVIERLKSLTGKKFIYFFDSGDDAIFWLMQHFKERGFKKILIPDCGGWFSYRKYPKKLGLEIVEIKTEDALIELDDFKSKLEADAFSIINSLGGYFVEEPMNTIYELCKHKFCILINDVSASIGTQYAKYGDFCVGSFGEHKPVELRIGGFIGSDIELSIEHSDFDNAENMERLLSELDHLQRKLDFWDGRRKLIMHDLNNSNILHKDSKGINIVVAYETESEKENLINYCDSHQLEYVLCPNYIKVNRQAISIEIKRIKEV